MWTLPRAPSISVTGLRRFPLNGLEDVGGRASHAPKDAYPLRQTRAWLKAARTEEKRQKIGQNRIGRRQDRTGQKWIGEDRAGYNSAGVDKCGPPCI